MSEVGREEKRSEGSASFRGIDNTCDKLSGAIRTAMWHLEAGKTLTDVDKAALGLAWTIGRVFTAVEYTFDKGYRLKPSSYKGHPGSSG